MDKANPPSAPNVISLSDYRTQRDVAARLSQRAPSYLLWYPGVGYLVGNAASSPPDAGKKPLYRDSLC